MRAGSSAYRLGQMALMAALLLSALVTRVSAQSEGERIAAVFAYFDKIGLPDVAGKPFVQITLLPWWQSGRADPETLYNYGILLDDDGKQFRVLSTDLDVIRYSRAKSKTRRMVDPHAKYVALSLAKHAKAVLKEMQAKEPLFLRSSDYPQKLYRLVTEGAIVAWMCSKNQKCDLSTQLMAEVFAHDYWFLDHLREEVEEVRMWRMILAFGDPSISWAEHLASFRSHARIFPKSSHNDRVKKTIEVLERMIAVGNHRKKLPLPGKPTKKERVGRLIYELRSQNGFQGDQPGACDIWWDPRGDKSPAHQLVDIGLDAVPQLIDALDDEAFTRQFGYVRDSFFSHHVLRVGDCCLLILQQIAHRPFFRGGYFHETPHHSGAVDETQKRVQAWWKRVLAKGELQVLIEDVERDGSDAALLARALVQKYPKSALLPLQRCIAKTRDDTRRDSLIYLIGNINGDEAVAALEEYVRQETTLRVRLTAAQALWARSPEQRARLVEAMVQEWKDLEKGHEVLGSFLALCGDVRGIEALAKRRAIVSSDVMWAIQSGDSRSDCPLELKSPSQAWLAAVEKFAVGCFELEKGWEGPSAPLANHSLAVAAARLLAGRWPQRYAFEDTRDRLDRERQFRKIMNTWRASQGLSLLPTLRPRSIKRLPAARVQPLVKKLLESTDQSSRKRAFADLVEWGLGALPELDKALQREKMFVKELVSKHKQRQASPGLRALETLTCRLGSIVREVYVGSRSARLAPMWIDKLRTLRGVSIDASRVRAIVLDFIDKPPAGVGRLELRIERGQDDLGLQYRVMLREGKPRGGVRYSFDVSADGHRLYHQSGTGTIDSTTGKDAHREFEQALREALTEYPCRGTMMAAIKVRLY